MDQCRTCICKTCFLAHSNGGAEGCGDCVECKEREYYWHSNHCSDYINLSLVQTTPQKLAAVCIQKIAVGYWDGQHVFRYQFNGEEYTSYEHAYTMMLRYFGINDEGGTNE